MKPLSSPQMTYKRKKKKEEEEEVDVEHIERKKKNLVINYAINMCILSLSLSLGPTDQPPFYSPLEDS